VLPIMTFKTEEEVIKLANDSEYGLNAYLWSKNRTRAEKVASKIAAGTVNINDSLFTHALPQTPWGGPKLSGMGRTHGTFGLLDLVQIRHVHINTRPSKKNFFWWYGYSPEKLTMMKSLTRMLFGRGSSRLGAVLKFLGLNSKVKVD
jgi:delta 1-pyrroline-5-carboxylate dehydrogenase